MGYNSLTIGVETGDEESLSFMYKGFGVKEIQVGNWAEETEIEKLYELRRLIEGLTIDTYFATMGVNQYL